MRKCNIFSQKRRYARALPQELHLIPQLLVDFGEINLYTKVSDKKIIKYEAIFKLDFIYKEI